MVFQDGGHHTVARLPGEPLRNHVDSFRGVLRKDGDARFPADEPGHLLVGMPVALGRDLRQAVDSPADVGPVTVLELDECLYHRLGRETRRSVVQVDNIAKDREIPADLFCGKFFSCR